MSHSAPRYVSPHGRQPAPPMRALVQFERTGSSHHGHGRPASHSCGHHDPHHAHSRHTASCDCGHAPSAHAVVRSEASARASVTLSGATLTGGVGGQPGYVVVYPSRVRSADPRFNPVGGAARSVSRLSRAHPQGRAYRPAHAPH
ncbi:MAG: hypothetical protein AAFX09_05495 [Pseudomonadota bacterium]